MLSTGLGWLSKQSFHLSLFRVPDQNRIIYAALIAATCLIGCSYKGFLHILSRHTPSPGAKSSSSPTSFNDASTSDIFPLTRRKYNHPSAPNGTTPVPRAMRYQRQVRLPKKTVVSSPRPPPPPPKSKQPYDVFLVLDIEATCQQGADFNYPNEIIEFPVCLMKWMDRSSDKMASKLEVVAEFRSFVKPTWRPNLTEFCTSLTGITQSQVDSAPPFPEVIEMFQAFMIKHGLLDAETGERLVRFCWCSDGPFDVRDFVVKQCFISKVLMPGWIQGDVLDVRTAVMDWLYAQAEPAKYTPEPRVWTGPRRSTLNIPAQLKTLGLPEFQGRQHSGIDDSRNIAKIVAELAWRGVSLYPNTAIHPNRRWHWMGKSGQVLEEHLSI
ncbi:ribonuclease H-like domain-containing protein [Collybia nuda]|uniref:Ribonuclease H-like domain-containing protein n=1 Tax=Collybia nuda TaxID=64659 RepID=A0A9P6CN65_9AGAR|nr:ribonuclease H-like domain-containing protein [Collybia nuda]